MKKLYFVLIIFILSFFVSSARAQTTTVCFCHNIQHNPITICTDDSGQINGHTQHVGEGTDELGECPNITPTDEPTPTDITPTDEPTPTDITPTDITPTEEPTPTDITPTEEPTDTPTPTPTCTPISFCNPFQTCNFMSMFSCLPTCSIMPSCGSICPTKTPTPTQIPTFTPTATPTKTPTPTCVPLPTCAPMQTCYTVPGCGTTSQTRVNVTVTNSNYTNVAQGASSISNTGSNTIIGNISLPNMCGTSCLPGGGTTITTGNAVNTFYQSFFGNKNKTIIGL